MDTACKYSRLYIYGLFLSRYLGLWRSIMFMSLYPLHLDMKLANFGRWWGKERPGMLQSRGCKKLDMTGQLNNNPLYWLIFNSFLDIYQLFYFLMFQLLHYTQKQLNMLLSFKLNKTKTKSLDSIEKLKHK